MSSQGREKKKPKMQPTLTRALSKGRQTFYLQQQQQAGKRAPKMLATAEFSAILHADNPTRVTKLNKKFKILDKFHLYLQLFGNS